jgi:putative sterol carrier protein
MKKYLALLISIALLVVALVAISGCQKAQTSQQPSQPTVQAPAPTTQAPAPATQAPAVAAQSTTTAPTTAPSATKPAASANQFEAYIQGLPAKLVASKVSGVTCTYQFNVTDTADKGPYWVKIAGGQCTVGDGTVDNPTLTITTPEQVWFDIVSKKLNGTTAFFAKQFTATPMSNIKYLQNMAGYFGQ